MRFPLALFLALGAPVVAQTTQSAHSSAPEPTGTVTGRVFCGDTNQPARFARVSVMPMPDPAKDDPGKRSLNATTLSSAATSPAPAVTNSVETTLDGSYTLHNVKPGRYYVVVEKEGYINPRAMFTPKELSDTSEQMRAVVEAALPHIRLEGNQTERADVRLERGAAISGSVVFDDGTPAGELRVKLLHKDESGKWVAVSGFSRKYGAGITTDDRGSFRMSSLLPDEYMLEADLSLEDTRTSITNGPGGRVMQFALANSRFALPFYGDGTPRQDEAHTFKLRQGEELTGQTITIPVSRLHRFTGHVAAGPDSHYVNAAALELLDRASGKQLASTNVAREDGLFHFEFVPAGEYILRVDNARDVAWDPAPPPKSLAPGAMPDPMAPQEVERTLQAYGGTEQPVQFDGEKLGYTITVPPDAANGAAGASSQTRHSGPPHTPESSAAAPR